MRRLVLSLSVIALVAGFIATPPASAQQSVNFYVGGFVPRAIDARGTDDVARNNLEFLAFDIKDFNGATVGGEWLVGLGDKFDAGFGVGFYQRTSPAVYADFVNADGAEIEQDLKLRIVPFTATIRFLPLGHHDAIVPYIGGGVGIFRWRYSETGEFVDFQNNNIFRDTFVGSGRRDRPGGSRRRARSRWGQASASAARSGIRRQGRPAVGLASPGTKIDLGGFNYLFTTFNVCGSDHAHRRFSVDPFAIAPAGRPAARRRARIRRGNAGSRARSSPACRRLPPSPRSAPSRRMGRGPSSAASQMSPLPSCRKSRIAKPARDASCM